MKQMVLSIAEKFSRFPAGRYPADGPFNGQRFREEQLIPSLERAISDKAILVVSLDGALGYSSSFLEEAFGGLVRSHRFDPATIKATLQLRADDVAYRPAKIDAESYIAEAIERETH